MVGIGVMEMILIGVVGVVSLLIVGGAIAAIVVAVSGGRGRNGGKP